MTTEHPAHAADSAPDARLVIVIEYDVCTDMQPALNEAMERVLEGADRLDPERIKVVGVHVGVEDFAGRVLALFAKAAAEVGPPAQTSSQSIAPQVDRDRPVPPPPGWRERT
jgi:hypothetical protein